MKDAYFSKAMLNDIRNAIQQTLVETFQVMFNINVNVKPHQGPVTLDEVVCSYIEMVHEDTKVLLSIATSKPVIKMICDRIERDPNKHTKAMIEDVISELTNIISNQLRTSFSYQHDIMFEIGLPKVCDPNYTVKGAQTLKVHFLVTPENIFDMDITYIETEGNVRGVI
jgi:CheY-specific phosphatase CheX